MQLKTIGNNSAVEVGTDEHHMTRKPCLVKYSLQVGNSKGLGNDWELSKAGKGFGKG